MTTDTYTPRVTVEISVNLAQRILDRMNERGLTWQTVADSLGMTRTHLIAAWRGDRLELEATT